MTYGHATRLYDTKHRHVWKSMEVGGVHWVGCSCGADSGQYELDQREAAMAELEEDFEHWLAGHGIFEADLRACDLCGEPGVGTDHPECLADEEGARFP